MTDKIIISRKEIEDVLRIPFSEQNYEIAVSIAIRALLDKAEVSEPVGFIKKFKSQDDYAWQFCADMRSMHQDILTNVDYKIVYTAPPDLEDKLLEANEREAYESSLASSRLIQIAELEAELRQQILECQRLNKLLEE